MPVPIAVALSLSIAHHVVVTPASAKLAPTLVPCSSATLSRCTGPCMGIGRAFGGRSPAGDKKQAQAQKSPPKSAEVISPPTVVRGQGQGVDNEDELYLARLSAVRYPGSRNALAAIRSAYAVNTHHSLADQLKLMEYKSELHRDAKNGKWTYPGWRGDVGIGLMAERWMFTDREWAREPHLCERITGKVYFQRAQALHEKMPERLPWSIWVSARSCLVYGFALCFVKPVASFVHFLNGSPGRWPE